jgi:hypothetical protein
MPPPTRERLLNLAHHLGPEASVIVLVLALEGPDGVVRTTLRGLVDRMRFAPGLIVAALLDLDRRNVLAIKPTPYADRLDTTHEIVAIHSRENGGFSAVSSIVRQRNVDVPQREDNERNAGVGGGPGDNRSTQAAGVQEDPAAWAEAAADLLGDRKNIACYHSFSKRYQRSLLDRALAIAASCPAERIRKSRGAYFVALVKRFAAAEANPEP